MKKWIMVMAVVAIAAIVLFFCTTQTKQRTLYLSWLPSKIVEDQIVGYRVYAGPTHQSIVNKKTVPVDVGNRHSYCLKVANANKLSSIFVAVTAYDANGNESMLSDILYFLPGNIVGGCDDEDDCLPYDQVRVDGDDLAVIKQYLGRSVTHQVIDCSKEFVVQVETPMQRADLNRDRKIDEKDLSILALQFGKALSP